MSEALIGSIIVGFLAMVGTIVTAKLQADKNLAVMQAEFKASEKRTDEKFENMNEKIDGVKGEMKDLRQETKKHNQVIERTYALEGRMNEAEHDIRDLKAKV